MNNELNDLKNEMQKLALAKGQLAYLKAIRPISGLNNFNKKSLYFVLCGDAVKIGVSNEPNFRVETLQTGAPGKLTLLAII